MSPKKISNNKSLTITNGCYSKFYGGIHDGIAHKQKDHWVFDLQGSTLRMLY
jgi:hypothetical protein